MKKIILLLSLFFVGCVNNTLYPLRVVDPVSENNMVQNQDLSLEVASNVSSIAIRLKNKTSNPIKIDWDSVSYIDSIGQANRVMHNEVKYISRDQPMAPTIIPPQSEIIDNILPTKNVYYASGKYGGWFRHPIFSDSEIGSKIRLYLPYEVNKLIKSLSIEMQILAPDKNANKFVLWE